MKSQSSKRPRQEGGIGRNAKSTKFASKAPASGNNTVSRRQRALEEDVLLGDGSGGDGDVFADFEQEPDNEEESSDKEIVNPEDLESADQKRLRMAKSLLQTLVRDASKAKGKGRSEAGRGAGGAEAEDDEDMPPMEEASDESEDEDEKHGITHAETFDAVAEKLRARHLSASGALVRPLSYALEAAFTAQDNAQEGHAALRAVGRKGHELPATCVAVSANGLYCYTGSVDCSIVRWRIDSSKLSQASAGQAVEGSELIVRDALYPGRRKTKADAARQQAQLKASKKGKGIIPVYGPGFGGGRAGPSGSQEAAAGSAAAGPRILHAGGVSTMVVPSKVEVGPDGEMKGISKKAATMARLRGLPDYGIAGHHGSVLCLAVSSDGLYLASGGKDRLVRLWEAQPPYVPTGGAAGKAGDNSEGAEASGPSSGSPAPSGAEAEQASAGAGVGSGRVATGAASLGIANIDNFVGHKDSVTGVAWRAGTHELVSVGADRLVKLWSADELSHRDTLFGHQSDITSIDLPPSGKERALTASRDKTVQLYKIPEATRLVFRGFAHDGSLEVVRAVSDSYFVTGAQDGSLSLWHVTRKKPVGTARFAHGTGIHVPVASEHAPAEVLRAATAHKGDAGGGPTTCLPVGALARSQDGPQPAEDTLQQIAAVTGADAEGGLSSGYCSWITSIAVCPNSDLIATGSGDGFVRFWRLVQRGAGAAGGGAPPKATSVATAHFTGLQHVAAVPVKGIVNGLAFCAGDSRSSTSSVSGSGSAPFLACAVGTEHRLGRWWRYRGQGVRNGVVIIPLPTA